MTPLVTYTPTHITLKEACQRAGLTRSGLRRFTDDGRLKSAMGWHEGRYKRLIAVADFEIWLDTVRLPRGTPRKADTGKETV